jgi:rod shape determining protein RodA
MATDPLSSRANWEVDAPEGGWLRRLHIDAPLMTGLLALCGFGLLVLYSAGDKDWVTVERQLLRLGIAFGVMLAIAQISPGQFKRWSLGLYVLGVLMLVAVLLIGDIGKGAQRWLDFGVVRFQPSELLKLAVPMTVAWVLSLRPCRRVCRACCWRPS